MESFDPAEVPDLCPMCGHRLEEDSAGKISVELDSGSWEYYVHDECAEFLLHKGFEG